METSDLSEQRTRPRSDELYRALKRAMIEQALRPGTRLPEDTIGDQFGVSRTIVRQALLRLQAEGMVETLPNRGAFVASPSLEEARQIFELRHVLEQEVIRKLTARISVNGLDALRAHVVREERVQGKDGPVSIRLAGEFHGLLADLTGNALLARYVGELVSRCSLILASYRLTHSTQCAVDEHRQIIAAIESKDVDHAMAIMTGHLGAVADRAKLDTVPEPDLETILARYGERIA